ncbi:MAG: V-type ATP synthase subunit E [Patescibacteria group bacterium]
MALTDILSAIDLKTEEEISQVNKEHETRATKIKGEYEEKLHQKKEELLREIKTTAERKVSQASFQVKSQVVAKVLRQKREIINQVFDKVLEKISNFDEANSQKLLLKLINDLPKIENGEIVPTTGSEENVKKALNNANTNFTIGNETAKGKGGFVFKAEGLVIDNTWEKLVEREKDNLETEIANILFYG